jgi:hypothetical protein
MTRNDFFLPLQADLLGIPVVRPSLTETTALGAAYLASLTVGVFESGEEIAAAGIPGIASNRRCLPRNGTRAMPAGGARLHKHGCAPDPAKHGAPRMRKGAMSVLVLGIAMGTTVSAHPAYLAPVVPGWRTRALITVGESVNDKPDGSPYRMVGIPDGLGAYARVSPCLRLAPVVTFTNPRLGSRWGGLPLAEAGMTPAGSAGAPKHIGSSCSHGTLASHCSSKQRGSAVPGQFGAHCYAVAAQTPSRSDL